MRKHYFSVNPTDSIFTYCLYLISIVPFGKETYSGEGSSALALWCEACPPLSGGDRDPWSPMWLMVTVHWQSGTQDAVSRDSIQADMGMQGHMEHFIAGGLSVYQGDTAPVCFSWGRVWHRDAGLAWRAGSVTTLSLDLPMDHPFLSHDAFRIRSSWASHGKLLPKFSVILGASSTSLLLLHIH